MRKIRTLIVDDEPIARRGIRRELEEDNDIEIIGECSNGGEAVIVIQEKSPDLVFLDMQMPELSGIDIVEAVGVERMPTVIFVTAFDNYALQAFDVFALDYLLKPFNSDRFKKSLNRAKLQIKRINKEGPNYLDRIMVKSSGKIFFLNVDEIDWIEAADNYVYLHAGKESYLIRETMNGMEGKLNQDRFIRIRRSMLVQIDRIKELQPLFNSEYSVILKDGTKLTSSRRYRKNLDKILKD